MYAVFQDTDRTPHVLTIKQYLFEPEHSQKEVDFLHPSTQKYSRCVDVFEPD
jgi:hypothetical protein